MILNNCTVCSVYGTDDAEQKRIRVKCTGDRIVLYLKSKYELSDSERVRIDFFDGQIGCIKTYCRPVIRKNNDPAALESWAADCEILDVIEIVQERRNLRAKMEKEITFTSFLQGEFSGNLQNISVDGLYFITRTRLGAEDTIKLHYTFVEKEHQLNAVILREENFRDGRYGYGCQFLELPKGAERDIKQYVFLWQNGRIW